MSLKQDKVCMMAIEWWEDETQFHSSITYMKAHPALKVLKTMGKTLLPYLFSRVELFIKEYDITKGLDHIDSFGQPIHHLMIAISAITKRHPRIPRADKGRVFKLAEHYLAWGEKMGYYSTKKD